MFEPRYLGCYEVLKTAPPKWNLGVTGEAGPERGHAVCGGIAQ